MGMIKGIGENIIKIKARRLLTYTSQGASKGFLARSCTALKVLFDSQHALTTSNLATNTRFTPLVPHALS